MNIKQLKGENNTPIWINFDLITSVEETENDRVNIHTLDNNIYTVAKPDFEAALTEYERDKKNDLPTGMDIRKLSDAIMRLQVHIPTSIRLHY